MNKVFPAEAVHLLLFGFGIALQHISTIAKTYKIANVAKYSVVTLKILPSTIPTTVDSLSAIKKCSRIYQTALRDYISPRLYGNRPLLQGVLRLNVPVIRYTSPSGHYTAVELPDIVLTQVGLCHAIYTVFCEVCDLTQLQHLKIRLVLGPHIHKRVHGVGGARQVQQLLLGSSVKMSV
jgi:hypothetical protein